MASLQVCSFRKELPEKPASLSASFMSSAAITQAAHRREAPLDPTLSRMIIIHAPFFLPLPPLSFLLQGILCGAI